LLQFFLAERVKAALKIRLEHAVSSSQSIWFEYNDRAPHRPPPTAGV
jgi:hypothetical protein